MAFFFDTTGSAVFYFHLLFFFSVIYMCFNVFLIFTCVLISICLLLLVNDGPLRNNPLLWFFLSVSYMHTLFSFLSFSFFGWGGGWLGGLVVFCELAILTDSQLDTRTINWACGWDRILWQPMNDDIMIKFAWSCLYWIIDM